MAPSRKRSFLRLLLILSLSALFLLSLYCSWSTPNLQPQFASSFPQNPTCNSTSSDDNYANNFTLTIKVLTFDRLVSLSRCLRSLANAQYGHDRVNLHIFVDHFKVTENRNEELDQRLNESRRILEFVDGFSWKFGEKMVHYRTGNVGLQAQWLEAWWPSSDHEFAFVVEDDLEVSPLYYKFLRGLILNYYYNSSNFHPSIYGASLQRPRFVPGKHGNKLQLDSGTSLFLYQLVGTWGQLLFPRPWKEFRLWYDTHKVKGIKPFLQGMVTTGWYKKMGERIWTPWFIKFIQSHGYYNIYINFSHKRALSISHRDAGVNYWRTAGPDSFLLAENSLNFDLLEMPPLSKLKWYDFCFTQVFPDRVVKSVDELGSVLHSLQKLETIVLVSLHGVPHSVTRNLLCHFERLNIRNYILVGPKSDFLLDLARLGHPVIDADQFVDNIQVQKLKPFKESGLDLAKEILVKAFVVKKTLELGYSTWVADENMLAVSSDSFSVSTDPNYDFYVGKTFKALFIRSSSSAKENWVDAFIYKVLTMVDPLKHKDTFPVDGRNFVSIVAEVLKQEGVKIGTIDAMGFDVTVSATNVNQSSLGDENKVVYWSSEMHLDFIAKQLEGLGFWIIDGDSSCTAVVCHQS